MIVLKFKTIAKYQVTHLIENANSKPEDNSSNENSSIIDKDANNKKSHLEKLDTFLGSFEDKDRVKVLEFF